MTPFPPDHLPENSSNDHDLAHFLRQNRPPVPPAKTNLETDILAAIAEPADHPVKLATPQIWRTRLWWMPPVLAASTIVAFWGYRALTPVTLSEAELATLAALIDNHQPSSSADPDLLNLLEL